MAAPRSLDVEPGRAEGRGRVVLVAVAALALLVIAIAAIVIAGNQSDSETDGARRASITDLVDGQRLGERVQVTAQVADVREGGRIFAIASPNTGEPDAVDEGAVLVVAAEGTDAVSEGRSVTVSGTVRELESEQVAEAAGRSLGGDDGYPDYRGRPVIVATDVTAG